MRTAAIQMASLPSRDDGAWATVVQRVGALGLELREPVGTLRVLVGDGGEEIAAPYLEARARVVGSGAEDQRFHGSVEVDEHGVPRWGRDDDADLMLVPRLEVGGLERVAKALAAGGLAVVGIRGEALGSAGRAGLRVVRVELVGEWTVAAVRDRREPVALPQAVEGSDRTMCVDRDRVLRAIEQEPWRGANGGRGSALVAALREQVERGEPELRALPWRASAARQESRAAGVDVLVVMPHPDDESVYAGGTLAGLGAAGQRVKVVVATGGAGGRGGPGLGGRRARELMAAAQVLGVCGVRCLGWDDFGKYRDAGRSQPVTAGDALRRWGVERGVAALVREIRRERPRVLLGLDPEVDPNYSLHGHHLGLGVLLAVAFHAAADDEYAPELGAAWECESHRVMAPVGHGRWGEALEIDRAAKERALRAHESQAYSTARVIEGLRDRRRAAVEITRHVQGRGGAWWVTRHRGGASVDAAIDWVTEAARVRGRAGRGALVDALRRQAGARLDAAGADSLRRLERDDAVAVVTGQQVGLLGGPAYTLAKALSAVALARRLQRRGIEAVPVFWLASYDHDLREVQRVPRWDGETLQLGLRDTGRPVGELRLGSEIEALCEQWAAGLPAGHAADVVELVRRTHRAEQGFGGAFGELLRAVTQGSGLVLLDPSDPAMARLARPLLQRAVVEAAAVSEALGEGRARLRARGQREVVPSGREGLALVFGLDAHGARRRVTRHDDVQEVVAAIERQPERFSPAALLRPLVQDALLPTIAYVAGPTEQRYLEQTHELYAWAGVPRPRIVPRVSLRLVEAGDVAALVEAGGVEALRGDPRPLERIGRAGLTGHASSWLEEVEALLEELTAARERGATGRAPERLHSQGLHAVDLHAVDLHAVGLHAVGLVEVERAAWRERLRRIEEHAAAALRSLPRTARSWPRAQASLHERAAAVLDEPGRSSRALTRLRHTLAGLRRSILRDGRRARPDAVAAWRRVGSSLGPAERRMTVAELLARGGSALAPGLLAALEHELSPVLELQLGGRR